MAFNVRQMPADQAAALIGEDDVAVFSPACGIMAATSQFDLEEPDSTRLTLLFEDDEDDLYREGKWLDGIDYMSDLVFETPSGLIGKASKLFGTFIGDGHATLSEVPPSSVRFSRFTASPASFFTAYGNMAEPPESVSYEMRGGIVHLGMAAPCADRGPARQIGWAFICGCQAFPTIRCLVAAVRLETSPLLCVNGLSFARPAEDGTGSAGFGEKVTRLNG